MFVYQWINERKKINKKKDSENEIQSKFTETKPNTTEYIYNCENAICCAIHSVDFIFQMLMAFVTELWSFITAAIAQWFVILHLLGNDFMSKNHSNSIPLMHVSISISKFSVINMDVQLSSPLELHTKSVLLIENIWKFFINL